MTVLHKEERGGWSRREQGEGELWCGEALEQGQLCRVLCTHMCKGLYL